MVIAVDLPAHASDEARFATGWLNLYVARLHDFESLTCGRAKKSARHASLITRFAHKDRGFWRMVRLKYDALKVDTEAGVDLLPGRAAADSENRWEDELSVVSRVVVLEDISVEEGAAVPGHVAPSRLKRVAQLAGSVSFRSQTPPEPELCAETQSRASSKSVAAANEIYVPLMIEDTCHFGSALSCWLSNPEPGAICRWHRSDGPARSRQAFAQNYLNI